MDQKSRDVENQYHHLVSERDYVKALQLITQNFDSFPKHAKGVVYFWKMKMACKLGDGSLALETLREAVEQGYWYVNLDKNPDFAFLADSGEFHDLVKLCERQRAEDIAQTKSVMRVLEPEPSSGKHPLLFALHCMATAVM